MKILSASLWLLTASTCFAQEQGTIGREATYGGISTVTIQATDQPGAVAEVVFENRLNNYEGDDAPSLTYDNITVEITFGFNVYGTADDTISVSVSPGYYAEPETVQVMEGFNGTILIYPELVS